MDFRWKMVHDLHRLLEEEYDSNEMAVDGFNNAYKNADNGKPWFCDILFPLRNDNPIFHFYHYEAALTMLPTVQFFVFVHTGDDPVYTFFEPAPTPRVRFFHELETQFRDMPIGPLGVK